MRRQLLTDCPPTAPGQIPRPKSGRVPSPFSRTGPEHVPALGRGARACTSLEPRQPRPPPPDLTGPGATPAAWRDWLDRAWHVRDFADAVETASPDLARQVSRIRSGGNVPDAAVRRAVLSVLRYMLRGTSRATPFGMLAGVAHARLGPRAVFRAGDGHRAVAKPDSTWLTGVTESLEADDELRPLLTAVTSDLVTERDGHLVIAHRPAGSPGGAPHRVQVRATRPVRTALEFARSPVQVAVLAAKLASDFPATAYDRIDGLIAQLIHLGFLCTSLRATMTNTDPLATLLAELGSIAPRRKGARPAGGHHRSRRPQHGTGCWRRP